MVIIHPGFSIGGTKIAPGTKFYEGTSASGQKKVIVQTSGAVSNPSFNSYSGGSSSNTTTSSKTAGAIVKETRNKVGINAPISSLGTMAMQQPQAQSVERNLAAERYVKISQPSNSSTKQLFSRKAQEKFNMSSDNDAVLRGTSSAGERFALGKSGTYTATTSKTARLMPQSFGGYSQPKKVYKDEPSLMTQYSPDLTSSRGLKEYLSFQAGKIRSNKSGGTTSKTFSDIGFGTLQAGGNIISAVETGGKLALKIPDYTVVKPATYFTKKITSKEYAGIKNDFNKGVSKTFQTTIDLPSKPALYYSDLIYNKNNARQKTKQTGDNLISAGMGYGVLIGNKLKSDEALTATVSTGVELATWYGVGKAAQYAFSPTKLTSTTETFISPKKTIGRATGSRVTKEIKDVIGGTQLAKREQAFFLKETKLGGSRFPVTVETFGEGSLTGYGKTTGGKFVTVKGRTTGSLYFPDKNIQMIFNRNPRRTETIFKSIDSNKIIKKTVVRNDLLITDYTSPKKIININEPKISKSTPLDISVRNRAAYISNPKSYVSERSLVKGKQIDSSFDITTRKGLFDIKETATVSEDIVLSQKARAKPTRIKFGTEGYFQAKKEGGAVLRFETPPKKTLQSPEIIFNAKQTKLIPSVEKTMMNIPESKIYSYESIRPGQFTRETIELRKTVGSRTIESSFIDFNKITENKLGQVVGYIKPRTPQPFLKSIGKRGSISPVSINDYGMNPLDSNVKRLQPVTPSPEIIVQSKRITASDPTKRFIPQSMFTNVIPEQRSFGAVTSLPSKKFGSYPVLERPSTITLNQRLSNNPVSLRLTETFGLTSKVGTVTEPKLNTDTLSRTTQSNLQSFKPMLSQSQRNRTQQTQTLRQNIDTEFNLRNDFQVIPKMKSRQDVRTKQAVRTNLFQFQNQLPLNETPFGGAGTPNIRFGDFWQDKIPPPIKFDLGKQKISSKKGKDEDYFRRTKYVPTIEAMAFNIKGSKPSRFDIAAGLDIRPIIKGGL